MTIQDENNQQPQSDESPQPSATEPNQQPPESEQQAPANDDAGSPQDMATELEKTRGQAEEYLGNWKRAAADYQNFKKQQERDRQNWVAMANQDLLLKLLPAIDDLHKALENVTPEIKESSWFDGLLLVNKKLDKSLEESGLDEIPAQGQKFDPQFHEAVMHEEVEGAEPDTNVSVLQKGYVLNGRVIRPSMVKVAK